MTRHEKSGFTVKVNGEEVHGFRKYLIGIVMGFLGAGLLMAGMFVLAGGFVIIAIMTGVLMVLTGIVMGIAGLFGGHGSHR